MEADENLIKFQGALLSLSRKNILNRIPDVIQAEKETICEIEELKNFVNCPSFTKSKIAYYMILNTELRVSEDLKNDEFIGLFVNIAPPITVQALIKWIDVLDLFKEFCKVVENSPSALGEELVWAILENPHFLNKKSVCFTLWSSVFKKICKIEKNCSDSPGGLIYYFQIISQKIELLDLKDVSHQNVCELEEFLRTVLCLVSYHKNPDPDEELYKLSIELRVTNGVEASNEKCIHFLFRTINNILKTLNVNTWDTSASYLEEWKIIRNLISRLLKEIEHLNAPSDVLDILSKLAIKESHAVIESLITGARNGQKFNWARDLINPGLAESKECPLHKINDDLELLLYEAFGHLENSGEEMKELFLAGVTLSQNQSKWLEMVFDKYQPNLLALSNTGKDLIESFNRIASTENVLPNIVIPLCMQSPIGTIKKFCQLAISTRTVNLQPFHVLKPACQVILPTGDSLLDHVIMGLLSEDLTEGEENTFCNFVLELRKENFIDCPFFENLIKRLKEFLEKDDLSKAVLCLTVMDSILVETQQVNKIALLVFMSQVLEHFSWDLHSFSTIKACGRDAVCSIVRQLMAELDYNTDLEILSQAREEVLKCWEVNQACFCDLWFGFGKTWNGSGKFDSFILALIYSSASRHKLRQFLLTFGPPDEIRTSIVLALTKVLPVLPSSTWTKALTELTDVWAKMNPSGSGVIYEVLQMFVSAWYLLTLQLNKHKDFHSCYKHCLAGFGRVFTFARTEEFLVRTFEKILFIMKSIEDEEIRKSCLVILLPVLKDRFAPALKEETKVHSEKIENILYEEFKN